MTKSAWPIAQNELLIGKYGRDINTFRSNHGHTKSFVFYFEPLSLGPSAKLEGFVCR